MEDREECGRASEGGAAAAQGSKQRLDDLVKGAAAVLGASLVDEHKVQPERKAAPVVSIE